MLIPCYTIRDLETFSPLGRWYLVSIEDHTPLAEFYNARWVTAEPLPAVTPGLMEESTLILEAA